MDARIEQGPLLNRFWPQLVAVFVVIIVLTGGISLLSPQMLLFQTLLSLLVLILGLYRLANIGFPTRLAFWAAVLVAGAIGLAMIQIIPLPPSVWRTFAGRDLVLQNFALLGRQAAWAPLSLSPQGTAAGGIAMLPGIAAFIAVLTISVRDFFWTCSAIIACAVVNVGLGLLQHFQGADSIFYFYDSAAGLGVGTFKNRNFFAAQLYCAIPILSAVAVAAQAQWGASRFVVIFVAIACVAIILAGLSLSGSRTGVLLAMPALLFAVVLAFSRSYGRRRFSRAAASFFALFLGILVVGQASMVALLRLAQTDPLKEYRLDISRMSFETALNYLPLGGGFGTFVPLFQLQETPEMMQPEFVNHAHNDWLELVIEGGVPAIVLMLAFLLWLFMTVVRVWRYGQGGQTALFQRMASLVVPLLLIHSIVDFPLRTAALMVVFSVCCGVMVLQPDILNAGLDRKARLRTDTPAKTPAANQQKPFKRPEEGFGSQRPERAKDTNNGKLQ